MNEKIFEPKGCRIKVQTCEFDSWHGVEHGVEHRHHECSWLSIALAPRESEILAEESDTWHLAFNGKYIYSV
jgi:hypothetical protein